LEKFIAIYGTGLFWVNKSIVADDAVKYVFLFLYPYVIEVIKKLVKLLNGRQKSIKELSEELNIG